MDRIIYQISMSTSLTIVRFLNKNLHSVVNPLDTCILSVIVICVSYVCGPKLLMSQLSRRLAVLLMVQTIQPLITRLVSVDVRIQSIMINAGIISIMSVIPLTLPEEIETIVTSIIYLYSDTLNFLVSWRREQLSILILLVALFRLNHTFMSKHPRLQQIFAISFITTISAIVQSTDEQVDDKILRFSLFLIVLHVLTTDTAHQVEDSILYSYVTFVQSTFHSEPLAASVLAFLTAFACRHLIGISAWPTRACILIGSNILVQTVLDYMQRLAVFDTIVTLKTTALVLQFFMQILAKFSFEPL